MNRLFFIAIILLSSCVSLNKVESVREKDLKTNEYTYSDTDSKIRYNISNDEKNLHIVLNTSDFNTINKMLRTGLRICFDVKGKKDKKVYLEYPLASDPQSQPRNRTRSAAGGAGGFSLDRMLEQIPNEAEFDRDGVKERIILAATDCDVKASIRAVSNSELTYDLVVPFNRISKAGISSLSKLSLGIVSGNTASRSNGESRSGGEGPSRSGGMGGGRSGSMGGMSGGRSGGMGGGRSGGMGGGGRMGGMSGGMSGERGSGSFDRSSMDKPVEFWFKLDLLK